MLKIQENINLAPFTTFKIGGPAKYFVEITSEEELKEAINWAKKQNEKFFILAGGSNVLFADEGFNGLIIKLNLNNLSINRHISEVEAGAGVVLAEVIMKACKEGLSGMENMYGIPGTVGGAVRGNAGAFGTEVKDVLKTVRILNTQSNRVREFTNLECAFKYRASVFKDNPEWVILSAIFILEDVADARTCETCARAILAERGRRQLQDVQAAGSFFTNPQANLQVQEIFEKDKGQQARNAQVPAGWLIEQAGLKGARAGGAHVSVQRANYIINTGGATAKDVLALSYKIKEAVQTKFDIKLQEEVNIVNF